MEMQIQSLFASFVGGEIVRLVADSGPVAQAVLVILLVFSIFSWSVMLAKWAALGRARVQSGRFLRAFRKADRKSTRLNSSHIQKSRMPSSA